jgi:serine/threonine-protein kinase RsbW
MAAVELRVPAERSSVSLARTAVASVCARLDFTLDRLEDVRLAVDEACSLLVADAAAGARLLVAIDPDDDGGLTVTMSTRTRSGRPPAAGSFAWTVLTTLVDDVLSRADADGEVLVELRVAREAVVGS